MTDLIKRDDAPEKIVAWGWSSPKTSGCYPHECHWMGAGYAHYIRVDLADPAAIREAALRDAGYDTTLTDRIEELVKERDALFRRATLAEEWRDHDKSCAEAAEAKLTKVMEALREIEADCNADYPPSHGAIKYAIRAVLAELEGK